MDFSPGSDVEGRQTIRTTLASHNDNIYVFIHVYQDIYMCTWCPLSENYAALCIGTSISRFSAIIIIIITCYYCRARAKISIHIYNQSIVFGFFEFSSEYNVYIHMEIERRKKKIPHPHTELIEFRYVFACGIALRIDFINSSYYFSVLFVIHSIISLF